MIEQLRVGNILKVSNHGLNKDELVGTYRIITARNIYDISKYGNLFEPIVLSPSILEKCGFKWNGKIWDDGKVQLIQGYLPEFYLNHVHYGKPYTTLHQLQNLYYALTQTELEIKL